MNNELEQVKQWASRDPFRYGYLVDFYERGGVRICYIAEDGIVLRNDSIPLCYAAGTVWDVPELKRTKLTLVDNKAVFEQLSPYYGYPFPAYQCYYRKSEPPKLEDRPGVVIRPLTQEDCDFVVKHYHNPGAYEAHIRGRIEEGMFGAEIDGELRGFAGVHQEGCLGLLEVIPEGRRRGAAELLEGNVIKMQLERGRIPYCHVVLDNNASIHLQKKLGMEFDPEPVYWLCGGPED